MHIDRISDEKPPLVHPPMGTQTTHQTITGTLRGV
jgi:hypothetical protein